MTIQQNVAEMMRMCKEQRHLSTAEFSSELEISRSTLQEYLNGTGNPSMVMLDHIAGKLDIDPVVLVSGMFEPSQIEIVLLLYRTTKEIIALPDGKRMRFAELFCEIISLWDKDSPVL